MADVEAAEECVPNKAEDLCRQAPPKAKVGVQAGREHERPPVVTVSPPPLRCRQPSLVLRHVSRSSGGLQLQWQSVSAHKSQDRDQAAVTSSPQELAPSARVRLCEADGVGRKYVHVS